ncbi:MAG TPA: hypothetical protein VGD67_21745 [Pseudonocardiaceae bacterium]
MSSPTRQQHRAMHLLWRRAGVTSRADRLALTSAVVRRPLSSSAELTEGEAGTVLAYMEELDRKPGRLAAAVRHFLSTRYAPRGAS